MSSARDYVLGTHQAEIDRLGLQHQVWRPHMLDAWSRAGMTRGSKVIDFGAGPGYALLPLMTDIGFKVREVRPLLFAVHPSHFTWPHSSRPMRRAWWSSDEFLGNGPMRWSEILSR
jgi:hypothetical protein